MNFAALVQTMTTARSLEQRVGKYDWEALSQELSNYGCAVMKSLLSQEECRETARLYDDEVRFRSHVHMGRHGFGKGEYRYFNTSRETSTACIRTSMAISPFRSKLQFCVPNRKRISLAESSS